MDHMTRVVLWITGHSDWRASKVTRHSNQLNFRSTSHPHNIISYFYLDPYTCEVHKMQCYLLLGPTLKWSTIAALQENGHRCVLEKTLDWNKVELVVNGECVYVCNVKDLEFGKVFFSHAPKQLYVNILFTACH